MTHGPHDRGSPGTGVAPHGAAAVRPSADAVRRPTLYGAVDLGTNNCRLLVARPEGQSFRVVDAFSRIVRLGEGLGHSGRLSDPAMARAIDALKACRAKLQDRQVARIGLIATEACRRAENGDAFIARVKAETGLGLSIIDRRTEAHLAAQGCAPLADHHASGALLFDIGGGSSEIVWLKARPPGPQGGPPQVEVRAWASLPVGVVTLSERHGGAHVTPGIFAHMTEDVADMVADFPGRQEVLREIDGAHLLGTSGTVTTLAGIHLRLPRYDRKRVDGVWMTSQEVDAVLDELLAMRFEDRVDHPCIGAERADLVLAGCAILEGIRRHFPCARLRVADRGLREGVLVGLMRADGVWRRRGPGERW